MWEWKDALGAQYKRSFKVDQNCRLIMRVSKNRIDETINFDSYLGKL